MKRRDFVGVAGMLAASQASGATKTPWLPGIKVAMQLGANPSDEDLQFMQQVGVNYAAVSVDRKDDNVANFVRIKTRIESAGLRVWNIGHDGESQSGRDRVESARAG